MEWHNYSIEFRSTLNSDGMGMRTQTAMWLAIEFTTNRTVTRLLFHIDMTIVKVINILGCYSNSDYIPTNNWTKNKVMKTTKQVPQHCTWTNNPDSTPWELGLKNGTRIIKTPVLPTTNLFILSLHVSS